MISTWLPRPFMPPKDLTIQASGVCFIEGGSIILVNDGKNWQLPGGAPEEDELLSETLIREIREEACLKIIDYEYIGCIKSERLTPVSEHEMPVFYKARFWVRAEKETFDPKFEIIERTEVHPNQLISMLSWNAQKTADSMLSDALLIEKKKSNDS